MSRSGQQHVVNGRIVGRCPAVMVTMWLRHATPPPLRPGPLGTALQDRLIGLARSRVATPPGGQIKKPLVGKCNSCTFVPAGWTSRASRARKRRGSFLKSDHGSMFCDSSHTNCRFGGGRAHDRVAEAVFL